MCFPPQNDGAVLPYAGCDPVDHRTRTRPTFLLAQLGTLFTDGRQATVRIHSYIDCVERDFVIMCCVEKGIRCYLKTVVKSSRIKALQSTVYVLTQEN